MNWKLSALAVLLALFSMTALVGCEKEARRRGPGPQYHVVTPECRRTGRRTRRHSNSGVFHPQARGSVAMLRGRGIICAAALVVSVLVVSGCGTSA